MRRLSDTVDDLIDNQLPGPIDGLTEPIRVALSNLQEYRRVEGIPPQSAEKDAKLLRALLDGRLDISPGIDIGESAASTSLNGSSGNPSSPRDFQLYVLAQYRLMRAFEADNGREATSDEIERIGIGFALITRDLIELTEDGHGEMGEVHILVRDGVALCLPIMGKYEPVRAFMDRMAK